MAQMKAFDKAHFRGFISLGQLFVYRLYMQCCQICIFVNNERLNFSIRALPPFNSTDLHCRLKLPCGKDRIDFGTEIDVSIEMILWFRKSGN